MKEENMYDNYRITKRVDGPTGEVTYTPEYYGWWFPWFFKRWRDFSYTGYNPVVCGHQRYEITFSSYEEAVAWINNNEEEKAKAKIKNTVSHLPVK